MKTQIFFKKPIKKYLLIALLITTSFCVNAQSKPWPVPSASINKANPSKGDAQALLTGKALYITYCTPCHGKSGKGDGAAAAALAVKPANHTSAAIQGESDGSLFYKVSEGRPPMPQYKATLSETQRWALISYIKTLGKKA